MSDSSDASGRLPEVPFDCGLLDSLMEERGLDVLLATSKHNVQYLLGGHRSAFFYSMDAIGVARYLPVLIYKKGHPEATAYIGSALEKDQCRNTPVWAPVAELKSGGTQDAMQLAIGHLRRLGLAASSIGIEPSFLPVDAGEALRQSLPDSRLLDCFQVLERLRARKRPDELQKLREASERVTEAMLAVVRSHGEGVSKNELVESLKREEVARGLDFEYCLISMGSTINRSPSDQRWQRGDTLSIDSGGSYQGYIGDLSRMAVLGEPDSELVDLLAEVKEIQAAATHVISHGTRGGDIYVAAERALERSPNRQSIRFVAHGVGIVSHEIPHLASGGRIPYEASDADRPLEAGMVVSVETDLSHPRRGFIKIEDTILVGDDGYEMFGEAGRDWNIGAVG